MSKAVVPLESNPEIFSDLAHKLGLTPILSFHDVFSLTEHDLLAFLPRPIYGVILLFPLTANYEHARKLADASGPRYNNEIVERVKWIPQTIKNGCGLYALLHTLANLDPQLVLKNSHIANLLEGINGSTLKDISFRVEHLESDLYNESAQQGQTEAPDADEDIYLHFIAYIKGNDHHIYELDGRRNGPIDLGPAAFPQGDNIIDEKIMVDKIQYYMNNVDDENKNNFSIMALAPSFN